VFCFSLCPQNSYCREFDTWGMLWSTTDTYCIILMVAVDDTTTCYRCSTDSRLSVSYIDSICVFSTMPRFWRISQWRWMVCWFCITNGCGAPVTSTVTTATAVARVEELWLCACGLQWASEVLPQQSAACTTSTRAVAERFHICTEDTLVLNCPTPLRCFYVISVPNTHALTYW